MTQPSGEWGDTIFFVSRSPLDKNAWYPNHVDADAGFVRNCGAQHKVKAYVEDYARGQGLPSQTFRWMARNSDTHVLQVFSVTSPVLTTSDELIDYTLPVGEEPEGPDTSVPIESTVVDVIQDNKIKAKAYMDLKEQEKQSAPRKRSRWTAWMFKTN